MGGGRGRAAASGRKSSVLTDRAAGASLSCQDCAESQRHADWSYLPVPPGAELAGLALAMAPGRPPSESLEPASRQPAPVWGLGGEAGVEGVKLYGLWDTWIHSVLHNLFFSYLF